MPWSAWRATVQLNSPLALKRGVLTQRDIIVLRYGDDQRTRWGEIAPLPGWSSDTLADSQCLLPGLKNQSPEQLMNQETLPDALTTGIAMLTQAEPNRTITVTSNALLTDAIDAVSFRSDVLKLKVGQHSLNEDIARANRVLNRLRPEQRLRLDANQSWTLQQAETFLAQLENTTKIDYIEEPLTAELNYRSWSSITAIPYALDERLRTQPSMDNSALNGLRALVIKPTLLGWQRTQYWIEAARKLAVQTVISSSFESPLGLFNLAQFAQRVAPDVVHGLATEAFLNCQLDPAMFDNSSEQPLLGCATWERLL